VRDFAAAFRGNDFNASRMSIRWYRHRRLCAGGNSQIHLALFIEADRSPTIQYDFVDARPCVLDRSNKEIEMVNVEDVMLVLGSIGIAASVYAQYVYRHSSDQLVRSPEPRASGADGAKRLHLVSAAGSREVGSQKRAMSPREHNRRF
jgi:hypothetical protein